MPDTCDLRHASPGRRLRKMTRNCRRLARGAWPRIALLIAAGCNRGPPPEVQARIDSLSQASSHRDRLMQEVAENTRLVSEISRELARVNVPARALKVSGESPLRASRDTLIQKIRYMTTGVKEIEPRLKESEQRIKDLTTLSDSMRNELASTMQNLQGVIANQKETIDALTLQVETLTAENSALRDTLENMSTISNTVYYVVGTKDELEQKGIIQEEGGARPFRGKTRAAPLPVVPISAQAPGLLSPDRVTCSGAPGFLWLVRSPERAWGRRETTAATRAPGRGTCDCPPTRPHELNLKG